MINSRTRGLLTMQAVLTIIILPLWFLAVAFLAELCGLNILAEQINFPAYIIGIAAAGLLVFNYHAQRVPRGPDRYQWVAAVRETNTGIVVLALALFAIVFATKDKAISRVFLGIYLASGWFLLLLLNRYLPMLLSRVVFRGDNYIRTVLAGSPTAAAKLRDWVVHQPPLGMKILGLVSQDEDGVDKLPIPVIGHISEFERILTEQRIQQVILLETRHSKAWVNYVVDICYREGCRILILNQWEEFFEQPLITIDEGEHTFFTLQDEPLENPSNRLMKRLLDITVSLPVVLILLPILCLIVKIQQMKQSPGPMFYKQKRSGFQGREFTIYKFRSMHHREKQSAEEEARQASKNDERIFPFGEFMRKTSLDEFPQFLNVLLGNMSVVGPRPHLPQHDDQFKRLVEIYKTRHFVKPGITGLAQYRGYRGEITDISTIRERIRLDLEYINNWSIWLDIGLIIKTFMQVLSPPKSAY